MLADVQRCITDGLFCVCSLRLQEAARRSDEEQRALRRSQVELQEGIEMKANSLYIDEVVCGQHREPVVIHGF